MTARDVYVQVQITYKQRDSDEIQVSWDISGALISQ